MARPRLKRLLRISLRMVFVLTTILCIWLGLKVRQVERQKAAVSWIESHGGYVTYDCQLYYDGPDDAFLLPDPRPTPPGPRWLHDLIGVDYFITPTAVSLFGDYELDDLSPLVNLTELTTLGVCCKVSTDFSPLVNLRNLKSLSLYCREVHDISPLLKLRKLTYLGLPSSVPAEEVVKLRGALPNCQILWSME